MELYFSYIELEDAAVFFLAEAFVSCLLAPAWNVALGPGIGAEKFENLAAFEALDFLGEPQDRHWAGQTLAVHGLFDAEIHLNYLLRDIPGYETPSGCSSDLTDRINRVEHSYNGENLPYRTVFGKHYFICLFNYFVF